MNVKLKVLYVYVSYNLTCTKGQKFVAAYMYSILHVIRTLGCFEEELSNGCDDRVVVVTIFYETKNTYKWTQLSWDRRVLIVKCRELRKTSIYYVALCSKTLLNFAYLVATCVTANVTYIRSFLGWRAEATSFIDVWRIDFLSATVCTYIPPCAQCNIFTLFWSLFYM